MRNAFAKTVTKLAKKDKKIILLSGDIGNNLFNEFRKKYRNRFYNCGIAEANMTSVASGLATLGLKPITYSSASFNTIRCLEQIRLDICYLNKPVIIVGTGAGLSYANLGSTHHSVEDIGILKNFPNLQILCPSDPNETAIALQLALKSKKPTYIRLGKKGEKNLNFDKKFNINQLNTVVKGKNNKLLIFTYGTIVSEVIKSVKLFNKNKIYPRIIKINSISTINKNEILKQINSFKKIAVVEEHSIINGFGSQIAEWCTLNGIAKKKFDIIGTPHKFLSSCGNLEEARDTFGLSARKIFSRLK